MADREGNPALMSLLDRLASNRAFCACRGLHCRPHADWAEDLNRYEPSRRVEQATREHHVTHDPAVKFRHQRKTVSARHTRSKVVNQRCYDRAMFAEGRAMDLSDGISLDLRRLCVASKVSAEIEPPPAFRGATLEQALHGGEDYELLFTASARNHVPARIAGVPITRIGYVTRGKRILVRDTDQIGHELQPGGWEHFRR